MGKAELITQIKNAQNDEDLQKIVDRVSVLSPTEREELEPHLEEMGSRFLSNAKGTINTVKIVMQLEDVSSYILTPYITNSEELKQVSLNLSY